LPKEFEIYLVDLADKTKRTYMSTVEGEDAAINHAEGIVRSIHKRVGKKYLTYDLKRYRKPKPEFYSGSRIKALETEVSKTFQGQRQSRYRKGDILTIVGDVQNTSDVPFINVEIGPIACMSIRYDPEKFVTVFQAPKPPPPEVIPEEDLRWREIYGPIFQAMINGTYEGP
jgi:hypothetical protein